MFTKTVGELLRRLFIRSSPSLKPISRHFGCDRGTPIDRLYIEDFLSAHRSSITGAILEVAESTYTNKYSHGISTSDVLSQTSDKPRITLVGDLTRKETLPQNRFDCFICTQTLNFIYDIHSAISNIHHLLKRNGVALVTLAGLAQISRYDMDRWGDFWRFTTCSAKKVFSEKFGEEQVSVESYGNVFAAKCFLDGYAVEELPRNELMFKDPDYQILIVVKAVKTD